MTYQVNGTCVPVSFLVLGPIENNVYIVDVGDGCVIVDPSCHANEIAEAVGERKVHAIVLTHGHWDHTGAAMQLRDTYGAPVIANALDVPYITGEGGDAHHKRLCIPCTVDRTVSDGEVLEFGNTSWRVIETPGHTPGGICFFIEPPEGAEGAPVLVSGDTLFNGTHGRTDFSESDPAAMAVSLKKLSELPAETIVLPGHNGLTTIGREKAWLEKGGLFR